MLLTLTHNPRARYKHGAARAIKVAVAQRRDIDTLSDDAIATVFEQLEDSFPRGVVAAWHEMIMQDRRDASVYTIDTLPELIIRKLATLGMVPQCMPSALAVAAEIEPVMVSFDSRQLIIRRGYEWVAPGEAVPVYGCVHVTMPLYSTLRAAVGMCNVHDLTLLARLQSQQVAGGKRATRMDRLLQLTKGGPSADPVVKRKVVSMSKPASKLAIAEITHDNTHIDMSDLHAAIRIMVGLRSDTEPYAHAVVPKRTIPEVYAPKHEVAFTTDKNLIAFGTAIGVAFVDMRWQTLMTLIHMQAWDMAYGNEDAIRARLASMAEYARMRDFERMQLRQRTENELAAIVQRRIVAKKFGPKRLKELIAGVALSKAEQATIDAEVARQEAYAQGVIGNKCPHVKLYSRFRRATSARDDNKLYKELTTYFGKREDGWIDCKVCKQHIMCSHVEAMRVEDMSKQRAALQPFISPMQYCKICAESLQGMAALDVGEIVDPKQFRDDALKQFIWTEAAQIMKYVRGVLIDPWQLCSLARDQLYDQVAAAERTILGSKSASLEEIGLKKHLYTAIIITAWVSHLIIANPALTWEGLKTPPPRKAVLATLSRGLEILLLSKNVIIRQINNMTDEMVKTKLIEAYRVVEHGPTAIPKSELFDPEFEVDPVFNALCEVVAKQDHKPVSRIKEAFMLELITVVRKNKEKSKKASAVVSKNTDAYNSIYERLLPDVELDPLFENIKPPTGGIYGGGAKNAHAKAKKESGSTLTYTAAYPGLVIASWDLLARAIRTRAWMLARDDAKLLELNARAEEVRRLEDVWRWHRNMATLQGWNRPPLDHTYKWQGDKVGLERLYDENASEHKWTRVIADGKEISLADVQKSMSAGDEVVIKDYKCAVCGVLLSKVDDLDRAKVEEAVANKGLVQSFFRFYETRCPKGGLHVWNGDAPCATCRMMAHTPPEQALAVFREHKATYIRDRAEMNRVAIVEVPPIERDNKYDVVFATYRGDFSKVVECANALKINQNLLASLGGMEKAVYEEVLSGKFIPVDPELSDRVTTLVEYRRMLYREWSQLRVHLRMIKPQSPLGKILDESGIPRGDMPAIVAEFEDIYDDFNEKLDAVRLLKPRIQAEWLLQDICEKLLLIVQQQGPTAKLRRDFVKYILAKMMRSDQLATKAGYFPWSIIYGDREAKETPAADDADNDVAVEDDGEDDGFDVEEEDQTGEDVANQVRVEGYGLD